MSTTSYLRFPLRTSLWYQFGGALITNGTLSNHSWEEKLRYATDRALTGRKSEFRSFQREHARSLRSPSPAPSPGWRGLPCSAGFPPWRTRTSSPICCCSSCSWRPAPCAFLLAWLGLAPHSAADSQPAMQQSEFCHCEIAAYFQLILRISLTWGSFWHLWLPFVILTANPKDVACLLPCWTGKLCLWLQWTVWRWVRLG